MHAHMHAYSHIHMHTHAHTQAHTHACTHIHTYKHTCVCTYIHRHTHLHKLVVETLVQGINLRWAWELVLKRLCYTYMYVYMWILQREIQKTKTKIVWCKEVWVSECIHCYGRMHVTWIKASQWCAWQKKKKVLWTSSNGNISIFCVL